MSPKIALACLLGACVVQVAVAAPSYTYRALGSKFESVTELNERGEVLVQSRAADSPSRASIVGPSGYVDLGTLGGMNTEAYGINNRGDAVGISTIPNGEWRGFVFSGGQMREFVPGQEVGPPRVINDRGDVAGGYGRPFFYRDGKIERFATTDSPVNDINESGVVVGALNIPGQAQRPYMYSQGKLTDLGTLGGQTGVATAINDLGAVVGYASTASEQGKAFLYQDGVMRDLGIPGANSAASDINNLGQVVGMADGRPILYSEGVLTDVNDLLPPGRNFELVDASDINDRQEILAAACFTGNDAPSGCFGALLTPVPAIPEPSSWLMLLAGAILLGYKAKSPQSAGLLS